MIEIIKWDDYKFEVIYKYSGLKRVDLNNDLIQIMKRGCDKLIKHKGMFLACNKIQELDFEDVADVECGSTDRGAEISNVAEAS